MALRLKKPPTQTASATQSSEDLDALFILEKDFSPCSLFRYERNILLESN